MICFPVSEGFPKHRMAFGGPFMAEQHFSYADHSGTGTIYAQIWLPETLPVRGVLQIAHGLNEYGGRYGDFAAYLNSQGWVVAAADHYGHGKSGSPGGQLGTLAPGHGWLHMLEDMRTLSSRLRRDWPDLPLFLMGHSMGSFLVRDLLLRYPDAYAGILLSGTGSNPRVLYDVGLGFCWILTLFKGRHGHSRLVRDLVLGRYARPFRTEGSPIAWLSRDPHVYQSCAQDPLCTYLPDLEYFLQFLAGMRHMDRPRKLAQLPKNLPILLFSGSRDPVGGNSRGVCRIYRRLVEQGCSVELLLYPGGRHEMLNEINKDQVYQDVWEWLEDHLAEGPHPS